MVVATISEKSEPYAQQVFEALRQAGLRAELDVGGEKIGAKIRRATLQKVPYILVVGEKEAAEGTVNVRDRATGQQSSMPPEAFVAKCQDAVARRALTEYHAVGGGSRNG
jgi:threonyl-tRNA synthetase